MQHGMIHSLVDQSSRLVRWKHASLVPIPWARDVAVHQFLLSAPADCPSAYIAAGEIHACQSSFASTCQQERCAEMWARTTVQKVA